MSNDNRSNLDIVGLQVTVDRLIFVSADNEYAVVRAYRDGNPDMEITLQGMFGRVNAGDHFCVSGFWKQTTRGRQLYCVEIGLAEISGQVLKDYLELGFITGITPLQGKRLWEAFGNGLPEVIAQSPSRILEIKGFTQPKLDKLLASWSEFEGKRAVQVSLTKLGIKLGTANRIINHYTKPHLAWKKIQRDPYALAWEIKGIGFIEADTIAMKLGIGKDSAIRKDGAVGYALFLGAKSGHCFLTVAGVQKAIVKSKDFAGMQGTSIEDVKDSGRRLSAKGKVIFRDDKLYLSSIYQAQRHVEEKAVELADLEWIFPELDDYLASYIRKSGLYLHDGQIEAIRRSCTEGISVITGGPGTGKTTIIDGIVNTLAGEKIALCAPTGRAAKKIAEATGREACTIHRLLQYQPPGVFEYNRENPLPYDVVVVDEASMLDVFLAANLFSAISDETRLVLVGDVDQLPSVGPGAVFKDIINSGICHVSRLTEIFRQSTGSYISVNASHIKAGNAAAVNLSNKTEDFFFLNVENDPKQYFRRLDAALNKLLILKFSLEDILILTPMNIGELGVHAVNAFLQNKLNAEGREVYKGTKYTFRVGDRVLQCVNDYESEVFNGDLGLIDGPLPGGGLRVRFPDKDVSYTRDTIANLALAYAMTIHKAQGSESPVVIQFISSSHYIMLKRSILYTGVTRAKRMCVLIGERRALKMAVAKDDTNERNSDLLAGLASAFGDLGAVA